MVSRAKIRSLFVDSRILRYIVVNASGLSLGLKKGTNNIDTEENSKMADRSCSVWLGLFITKV